GELLEVGDRSVGERLSGGLCLMWAISVVSNRLITVVAESAETFREAVPFQPMEKIPAATQLLSVPVASAVDVFNAEKLVGGLPATGAHFAIVLDGFGFPRLMPFTGVGMARFLVEKALLLYVCSTL